MPPAPLQLVEVAWAGRGQVEQDASAQPLTGNDASTHDEPPQSFHPALHTHWSPTATHWPAASHVKAQVPPGPVQLTDVAWAGEGQAVQETAEQPVAVETCTQASPPQSFQPVSQTHELPLATHCPEASHVKLQVPPDPPQVAVAWLGSGHGLHDALAHPVDGRLALTQTPPQDFSPPGQPQYVP